MNLKLKKYRESEGLTQKEFAKKIGKSIGTIQSWERGDSFPNAVSIWDMCLFFKTDPNDLLGWYEEYPQLDAPHLSAEEAEMLQCYRDATPTWRTNITMTARAAAGESKKKTEDYQIQKAVGE